MKGHFSTKVLRSLDEIEEVRLAWESWPGHRDSECHFFIEFVNSNPSTVRPHVIVAYRNERPDAILIGRIDETILPLKIGYWKIPMPRVRLLTFAMGAHRGSDCQVVCELLIREALRSLHRTEADAIRLDYVDANSPLCHFARNVPGIFARDYAALQVPHWLMELPASYEGMMKALSANLRNQIRRKAKKMEAEFPNLLVRCFDQPEDLGEMMMDVESVAAKSYQRGLRVGFRHDDAMRRTLLSQMARGKYLGYVLYLDDRPAAYWLGSCIDSAFYSDYLAFHPEFSSHSPGMYLQAKVIEDLLRRQVHRIDFGPGDARYKTQFGTSCRKEITLHIFPPTLQGVTLNLLRSAMSFGDRSAKAFARGTGLLPRLKKAFRRVEQSARTAN